MTRAIVIAVLWLLATSTTPQAQPVPRALGVSIGWQRGAAAADLVLATFAPSVWMDWVHNPLRMSDDSYAPMAYSLKATYAQRYIDAAADTPGRFWLLGSEPHCCGTGTNPIEAAAFVQRWQAEVGGDYACCGVVLWDGYGWREWLEAYLLAGGPKSPYCHAHLFSRFAVPHITDLRAWLDEHAWDCELILSEVADPWDSVANNIHLMSEVARLIADGRVQAAIWYSADPYRDYHGLWPNTGLLDDGGVTITPLGYHWLSLQPGGANDPRATATPGMESMMWLPELRIE